MSTHYRCPQSIALLLGGVALSVLATIGLTIGLASRVPPPPAWAVVLVIPLVLAFPLFIGLRPSRFATVWTVSPSVISYGVPARGFLVSFQCANGNFVQLSSGAIWVKATDSAGRVVAFPRTLRRSTDRKPCVAQLENGVLVWR